MTTEFNKNTHTEHCCVFHGCKYETEDCPVVTKKQRQSYPCMDCEPGPVGDPQSVAIREAAEEFRKLEQEERFMDAVASVAASGSAGECEAALNRLDAIRNAKKALLKTFVRDWLAPAQALPEKL